VQSIVMKSRHVGLTAEGGEYMTRTEAAKYLRVSSAHVSNLAHGRVRGMPRLRVCRAGRRLIFRRIWLDEFVEAAAAAGGQDDTI
jgi:excisionase family DNA binding protein